MLAGARDAVAVGEALNWFRPTKTHHFELSCACGDPECSRWVELSRTEEDGFHAAIARQTGSRFVVDSSKELSWLIDTRRWANQRGMSVSNVFVWKDPIQLSYSFWKRTGDPNLWRYEFLTYYNRLRQTGIPLIAINLGDVLAEPRMKLGQLCDALGMVYVDGMERFWNVEHHHLFGNYGVRRQSQIGDSLLEPPVFSQEFQVHVDRLEREIREDAEVGELVARLRSADVSNADQNLIDSTVPRISHPLPVWYYGQRFKRGIRRIKPRSNNLPRTHSAATIPVEEHGGDR